MPKYAIGFSTMGLIVVRFEVFNFAKVYCKRKRKQQDSSIIPR